MDPDRFTRDRAAGVPCLALGSRSQARTCSTAPLYVSAFPTMLRPDLLSDNTTSA
jgi:hypothetical protein